MNYELTLINKAAMPVKTGALKWWSFHQNNSGGYWEIDDNVSQWVHIQEASVDDAIAILEYMTAHHSSCACCGERWSTWADEDDGNEQPMVYGETLDVYENKKNYGWCAEPTGKHRLHFFDGRIAAYKVAPSETVIPMEQIK